MINEKTMLVAEAFDECLDKARRMFPNKVPRMVLSFDLRGKLLGQCAWNRKDLTKFTIRLNADLVQNNAKLHIETTIPHEIAHAICIANGWGEGHTQSWSAVCKKLGGDGERLAANEHTVYAKSGTFEYVASCGTPVRVSGIIHRRIQEGKSGRVVRSTGGKVDKENTWSKVA